MVDKGALPNIEQLRLSCNGELKDEGIASNTFEWIGEEQEES